MNLITQQKIIKIGTSLGVTLPAKELKRLDINLGDEVEITIKSLKTDKNDQLNQLVAQYQDFKEKFDETISRLS